MLILWLAIIQIIASIFTCIGIVIALFEFHFMKKSTVAEHERIQKQATIDYYNSICEKLYSLNHVIYEKYKRNRINYSEIEDDEEFLSVIKTYLNTMEILATAKMSNADDIMKIANQIKDEILSKYDTSEIAKQYAMALVNATAEMSNADDRLKIANQIKDELLSKYDIPKMVLWYAMALGDATAEMSDDDKK